MLVSVGRTKISVSAVLAYRKPGKASTFSVKCDLVYNVIDLVSLMTDNIVY